MDAAFLATLANYAAPQPTGATIAIGAIAGALLTGALFNKLGRMAGIRNPAGLGVTAMLAGAALGFFAVHIASSWQAQNVPTPLEVTTTALTTYLTDAADLTITGPIELTTGDPTHTDIAHAPGRAEARAHNADGDLFDVIVTWSDPSTGDNPVTVTTTPATSTTPAK